MKPYQIISRKYRPQSFQEMIGQEAIVQTLKNALKFQYFAQAYLFCGSRGTGKTTLARLFAKALNCQQLSTDHEPCNRCLSCQEIASGRSLDVIEIDGASNRGIDDIRELNENVGYSPASGKYKIYIIDEVHMLTKEAFNALLKTLEEPPKNVKFFFATTEPHKVLLTIVSRCQRFDLSRISLEEIQKKLKTISRDLNRTISEEALHQIALLSDGSLRDAESLLDQLFCSCSDEITLQIAQEFLGIPPRSLFFELDLAIHRSDLAFGFTVTEKIFSLGKEIRPFLDSLLEHYRSLLLIKMGKEVSFSNSEEALAYRKSASLFTQEQCLHILDLLIEADQQLNQSSYKRIQLEMILSQIIRSSRHLPIESLVQRLIELEKRLESESKSPAPAVKVEVVQPINEAPIKSLKVEEKKQPVPSAPPISSNRLETLMRFAAVELEGSLHQDKN